MKIEGSDAKGFNAVRLDNFENANKGELVMADEETGEVTFKDTPDSLKTLKLGDHAIRICRRSPYGG